MLPRHQPDRLQIAFDDHRLVSNAGLILPSTLALRLGLPQLVDRHLDLGHAKGRANTGDKMMTLVASALAGGDCIDDADVLRAAGRPAFSVSRLRRPPPWAPSCAASGGATSANSTRVSRRVAGPGLGGRRRTRRRAPDHRPGLHHLRDLWTGQGRGAPPWLHRQAGLSPAAGYRRRNRRRADGPAARGPGQHRPRRRPLPA